MEKQNFEIKAGIQIARIPSEVFEAIAEPAQMSNYFIAGGSGRIEEGKAINWRFPEFDMDVPVKGGTVEEGKYISFHWEGSQGHQTMVEIELKPVDNGSATHVTVYERGLENNEAGIKWLKSNTEGWANFLACLKAWMEYGINLRKGAFDFLKEAK